MTIRTRLKGVVASLAMEATLEAVRGYLLELLEPVTPEHVYRAIKEDADPWDYTQKRVRNRGMYWARKLRRYQDRLTPSLVLEWLRKDRPDLASLILNMGPEGRSWLAKRTQGIKNSLWPPLKLKLKEMPKTETEEKAEEAKEKKFKML